MAFPTSRLAKAAIFAVSAGLVLPLAACGSGSSDSADSSEASGSFSDAKVAPPTVLSEGELKVCTTSSNPPNTFVDENAELTGVEIDMARALAEELGVKANLEEYAFSGLIPALQAKQCDVIMGSLYITPKREEIANFVPYLYSGTGVGVAADNPAKITGPDTSLCGKSVIGITGATGANGAEQLSRDCEAEGKDPVELTLVDSSTSAVQQVLASQVDAFMDTGELMAYYEQKSDGEFTVVGGIVGKIRIGAATLVDNRDLNEALDTGFQAIIDNGKYREILDNWGISANDITQPE